MRLTDMARVIRSKNAGPFLLTLDVLFKGEAEYQRFRKSGLMTKETAARLYGIPKEEIESVIFFDPAHALKITLRRPVVSGGHGDTDIYGAQQHIPLINWEFDL